MGTQASFISTNRNSDLDKIIPYKKIFKDKEHSIIEELNISYEANNEGDSILIDKMTR